MPGDNKTIRFRDLDSPLGPMIAGASDSSLCFLEWHDRGGVERIKERVAKRYRATLCEGNNSQLDNLETELSAYFSGELIEFTTPLDIQGTGFEKQVWDLLLALPFGRTRCYGDLAKELGKPGASRAVGRANGANYLSIVIPCHRVIESTGQLRGYGGGLWRKKRLLDLESGQESFD